MELYKYQQVIAKNLGIYIRLKGYSKSSFAKLSGISRPTLNNILDGESPNPTTYREQMLRITKGLELPIDYFLSSPAIAVERWQTPMVQYSDRAGAGERGILVKELLEDLDELMSVSALYL